MPFGEHADLPWNGTKVEPKPGITLVCKNCKEPIRVATQEERLSIGYPDSSPTIYRHLENGFQSAYWLCFLAHACFAEVAE